MIAPATPLRAERVRVTGVVQGVGFRPFVYRLAVRHGLAGFVRNVGGEVEIGIEGQEAAVQAFHRALTAEAPPLARIDEIAVEAVAPAERAGFRIDPSGGATSRPQPVSPDAALCPTCEAELYDPANRRYRYPFITCTDCGPRFTVIESLPYDRERTSMRVFAQCPTCELEYHSPADRRYHSETNSCAACGPRLWFEGSQEPAAGNTSADAITAAARLLRHGGVVALRGLGGYHLAVDATSDHAVRRLRDRKGRPAKPFAVMVRTIADAAALGIVDAGIAALLLSPARPVVVVPRRADAPLSDLVAPGLGSIGILLPSTPVHHLLLEAVGGPLVMTSGNVSDEPIAIDNDEARRELAAVADGFLMHDRAIIARYDDSVLRPGASEPVFLRRARGFAPLPIALPVPAARGILATGPDLKNTFTLAIGRRAYVSQHIGNLDTLETVAHFRDTLRRFEMLFGVTPDIAACDLHPGYLSTQLAENAGLSEIIRVQHHHAHIAAVLAEHGETAPALGVAYDGTGYGDDGHTWGAELLLANLVGYRRLAHLRYAPMPGGDRAAREPWRAALGYLSLDPACATSFAAAFCEVGERQHAVATTQVARRLNAPLASSMGRLFDAAAAILGVHAGAQYEGEAAMKLESLAGARAGRVIPIAIRGDFVDGWTLDPLPLLCGLGEGLAGGRAIEDLTADFHDSIIAGTIELLDRARQATGLTTVVLAGGTFQNVRLGRTLSAALETRGFRVLVPRLLSPNDGAISYGQAAIAAARLASRPDPQHGGSPCA